ncbi:hypothetical protein, conserved [Eimeria praecox]|uniref:Uncharacterized protein n=1 Tax=Eimeria praecox TaxID=51316 RepID=U6G7A7_9EIME|nr:hypothetical protein, conserved [Eimeria praecox]
MASHPHFGAEPPSQSALYAATPSTASVAPPAGSNLSHASHWPKSNFRKRGLGHPRKHLTILSCALLVVIVLGAYCCRLKSRSGQTAVLTTRKLAGADGNDDLRSIEEALASELCEFFGDLTGRAPLAEASGEAVVSSTSEEVQTGTQCGKRKRKTAHLQHQEDKPIGSFQVNDVYQSSVVPVQGGFLSSLLEDSEAEDEIKGAAGKRARMSEWHMDPVGDLEVLLRASQGSSSGNVSTSEQQFGFRTGADSLSGTAVYPPSGSLATSQLFLNPYQFQSAPGWSTSSIYPVEMAGDAYAAQHTRGDFATAGAWGADASSTSFGNSVFGDAAGNAVPQAQTGYLHPESATMHSTWLGPWGGYGELSQALAPGPQLQPEATDDGANRWYSSTLSLSDLIMPPIAGSSAHEQQASSMVQEEHASTGMPPSGGDDAAILPSQDELLKEHPFYRVPPLQPGVTPRNFDWQRPLRSLAVPRQLPQRLLLFQRTIRKAQLSDEDLNLLMEACWDLLRFAASTRDKRLAKSSFCELVEPISLRFLVADALWCACEIFGEAAQKGRWWHAVMEQMTAPPVILGDPPLRPSGPSGQWRQFVEDVTAALLVYRTGNRPSPKDVVRIKKTMFGPPPIHRCFNGMVWDWWRRDVEKSDELA